MPHYKNQDASILYWLDEGVDPIEWLPEAAEEVTEEEADIIRQSINEKASIAHVITSVTMRQARLALLQAGLLSSINAAIQAIPDDIQRQAAAIEWEFASTVDRNSAFTQNLATALGLDSSTLDELFELASTL